MRRWAFAIAAIAAVIAVFVVERLVPRPLSPAAVATRDQPAAPRPPAAAPRVAAARVVTPIPPPPPEPAPGPVDAPSHLADELNAPAGNIRRDLDIMNEIFVAWQTNFTRAGNPVGENAEITAALTGGNPLHFAFIPRDHPAINARGELCDRWGTPFRFHQLSGSAMEIRSAGPDRKFGTPDDADFTPTTMGNR